MGEIDAFTERAALLALLDERPPLPGEHRRASWPEIASEVSIRGSASSLWEETRALTLDTMADPDGVLAAARHRLQAWADADFDVLTVLDTEYPLALRGIHDMPPILFTKGRLRSDDVAVSVVGSRQASAKGRSMADNIATGLVSCARN
jgi:DNA processing protein